MKKHKILCLITLACYLLFTVLGAILTASLYEITQTPSPEGSSASEGLAHGFAGLAAAIVMVLTLGYTLLSLIPLALKLLHTFFEKKFLGVLCLLLDAVFLVLHIALLVGGLSSGDALTFGNGVLYITLLLASITAIVTNMMTLRNPRVLQ